MSTKEQASQGAVRRPPPLPPRQTSSAAPYDEPPPAYDDISDPPEVTLDHSWTTQDPRSSSTQSLTPTDSNVQGGRRRLLCIYIHGFMGNETSFRSFPAHVHNLLTVLLAETHVVHTKIYPRYRSKRNISYARDDFSRWLEPHESETTDVVLLGHSMGGLISAEVAIMPPAPPASRPLKHKLLGTINFDVPFLGMHPGVVKSGLASIFAAPPEAPGDKWEGTDLRPVDGAASPGASQPTSPLQHQDTLWQPGQSDPNYNPSFQNDVVLPVRKGWSSAWHFINKHSDSLGKATKQLVTSHMEFGGAMANYVELKARYARLRALEEENVAIRKSVATGNVAPPRVRFVNYYTASTGRPKKPKSPAGAELPDGVGGGASLEVQSRESKATEDDTASVPPVSRNEESTEAHGDNNSHGSDAGGPSSDDEDAFHDAVDSPPMADMEHIDPTPHVDSEDERHEEGLSPPDRTLSKTTSMLSETTSLPPIPDPPTAPAPLDISFITDKDTRKLVEKEHARAVKAYEKAVKERERIIKDRAKLEEKRGRKAKQEIERAEKEARKARTKAEAADAKAMRKEEERPLTHSEREEIRLAKERERMEREGRRLRGEPSPPSTAAPSIVEPPTSPSPPASTPSTSVPSPDRHTSSPPISVPPSSSSHKPKEEKPPKDRKFCTLPPKDSNGQRDPCWIRIFMKDVDEVGAHCGLFFVDERYERLVGDVAERVEGWVRGV